jgi:hypothetical protein
MRTEPYQMPVWIPQGALQKPVEEPFPGHGADGIGQSLPGEGAISGLMRPKSV